METLNEILSEAATEEALINSFATFFNVERGEKIFVDLYTPQILFEFNLRASLKTSKSRAACLAKTLYYVHRLKYGDDERAVSNNICVVTKTAAVVFATKNFSRFLKKKSYDWDTSSKSPDKKLIADLAADETVQAAQVYRFADAEKIFIALIRNTLAAPVKSFDERKDINENNFLPIFQRWQEIFGDTINDGRKPAEYFITDIEAGTSKIRGDKILFSMSGGEVVEKPVDVNAYKKFWRTCGKVKSSRVLSSIRQKMDNMTDLTQRRFTGEYFTPIAFAKKAVEYLARTVGKDWYKSGKFRLWDMAAGTGNLECALPADALKYCYISTLLKDDADYCRKIFPDATVFQYDYLNDDVNFFGREFIMQVLGIERKMPAQLVADLANPDLRWIIFINPPYVTANSFERTENPETTRGVSMTAIRKLMRKDDLGETSRELFSQFIYRISREFADRQAWLGIFSKIKYINSNNDQRLRDKVFSYKFERGFVFRSENFDGCKRQFPVGFLVWNLAEKISLEEQKISLDVYNSQVEKEGEKIFYSVNRRDFLSKWLARPPAVKKFPPLSAALNLAAHSKNRRDKVAEKFLASFVCVSNGCTYREFTSLLSGAYVGGGAVSVTPENFERAMVIHMVRRLLKKTWLNDQDQLMQPTQELSAEFVADAVIWSLFAPSNHTASLRGVEYEGEIYRIPNNFFPFTLAEVRDWECSSPEIKSQLETETADRFAATWLKNRALSAEAAAVLTAGRELYKKFFAELEHLDVRRWKIADWDAGWYQIRMATGATVNLSGLSAKLLPQIYELGFLREDVKYF